MKRRMRTSLVLAAFSLILAVSFTAARQAGETPAVMLERAIQLETVDGDLAAAIALYQRIITQNGNNRAVTAKALLRLGLCQLKLGKKEAQSAFQKVIDDYSDQSETVKQAREQLSVLLRAQTPAEKGSREYKITKIHTDSRNGWLSPDGRSLAFIDNKCLLSLRNIASGKEVCLVTTPFSLDDEILELLWSPDSKLIAYLTLFNRIAIVAADGGQPRMIIGEISKMNKGTEVYPMTWTSDSKKLIFFVVTEKSYEGLYAIPATGGRWEEIYKFPDPQKAKEHGVWPKLSPDGNLIAYSSKQDGNQDIYVMPVRGGDPVRITDDPANDGGPMWSYDGQWLAFSSSRTEGSGTWVIRITPDGKPGSQPVMAVRGAGNRVWTQDGKIAYSTRTSSVDIFTAYTDGTQEIKLTKLNQHNSRPRWSPDGKNIVFDALYDDRWTVLTVPANGGEPEKFLAYGTCPAWSPDGKEIAFVNAEFGSKAIISVIPAGGGKPREIMNYDGYLDAIDWSPDGRYIAFHYGRADKYKNPIPDRQGSDLNIYTIPVAGGAPKRLTGTDKKKVNFSGPRWSPDGRRIAFVRWNMPGIQEPGEGIYTINVEGGEPRFITNEAGRAFCWSRDGNSIIFPKLEKESVWLGELYRVSAEGGTLEKLNIRGGTPDLSPDGKRIAFYRRTEARTEFWLAENFLPTDKKEK